MSEENQEQQESGVFEPKKAAEAEGEVEAQKTQQAEQEGEQKLDLAKAEELTEEQIDASDASDSLKTALKREKRRLRKERQNRAQLEQRLQEVESKFNEIDSKHSADAVLKEIETDLGLDEEQTKKFYAAVKKIAGKTEKEPQDQDSRSRNFTPKQTDFVKKVQEARRSYSEEEWNEMSPYMHKVMKQEMKNLNQLGLDPEDVYDESVHSYYAKAVKLKAREDALSDRNQKVQQNQAKNLASSESSVDSSGRPVDQKITQEVFNKNRSNPEWVKKNRQKIIKAASQGIIRG